MAKERESNSGTYFILLAILYIRTTIKMCICTRAWNIYVEVDTDAKWLSLVVPYVHESESLTHTHTVLYTKLR